MMRKLLTIILLFLTLVSCADIIKHRHFTYCAHHGSSRSFSNIKTNGYYFLNTDKYIAVFLLYKDGTFANLSVGYQSHKEIQQYFDKTPHKILVGNNLLGWGRYIIVGDTLKAQYIALNTSVIYEVAERWFTLANDSTLCAVKSICSFCTDPRIWNNGVHIYEKPEYYHLMPFANKPDSACWIKKKRWYWCK